MYGARGSFVPVRSKKEVNPLTQSAEKWICMEKWAVPNWGIYFHPLLVLARVPEFFPNADGSVVLGKFTPVHNGQGGGGKNK